MWEKNYVSREDFLYKLRDVYYWWTHKVSGKLGQVTMGTSREASKDDPGWITQFYIFCYCLCTIFFVHKGGKRARLGHLNIPKSFIDLIKGDNQTPRHKEWGIKFNELLERARQLNRLDCIIVPPLVFEDAALAMFALVYQQFNSKEEYYLAASRYGEKKYGNVLVKEVSQVKDVEVLHTWIVENLMEQEVTSTSFLGSSSSSSSSSSSASSSSAFSYVNDDGEEAKKETTITETRIAKWENVARKAIEMLTITAIQTRKKQLGIEASTEGFRQTLNVLQQSGSDKRAKNDGLVLKKEVKK